MALMLAAAGATGRFPGGPRDLLERGTKMLAGSPEAAKISETVRKELFGAAKAAAVTAASQRIDSLSNRLLGGADAVSGTVHSASDSVGEAARVPRLSRKGRARSRDDAAIEDEEATAEGEADLGDEEADEPEESKEPPPRPRSASRRTNSRDSRSTGAARKSKSDRDEEEEKHPRPHKTRANAATDSAPVRRSRR
jgi:hypothetical protein